jgi:xylulokinase
VLGPAGELPALQQMAPALLGARIVIPQPADYAALGAARQAAWSLGAVMGTGSAEHPPRWQGAALQQIEPGEDDLPIGQAVRQQYASVRDQIHPGAFPGSG